MKLFWKLLGAAVLAVGLTPYRVEKDDETGEKRYQALLWQATRIPREGDRDALDINIGFKKPSTAEDEDEPHLFSDELCVEYTGAPVTEEPVPETSAEEEKPAEEAPAVPTEAAVEAPAEAPGEENRDEA